MRRVRFGRVALLGVVCGLAYLLLWPTSIEPRAWEPRPPTPLTGVSALNNRLEGPDAVTLTSLGSTVAHRADRDPDPRRRHQARVKWTKATSRGCAVDRR